MAQLINLKLFIPFLILLIISCATSSKERENSPGISSKTQREVVCFVYHRVGDSRYPSTNISIENFKAHLQYLKNQGYEVMTLGDAIDYLKGSSSEKKVAVISIDDGFKSFYENGFPLLKQYKFPATIFINTETVGGNSYMDWKELKALHEAGVEIGNHTHSHAFFLNLSEDKRYETFKDEIVQSQKLIKDNLDVTPQCFAYPYGEFDQKMQSIVKSEGFKAAAAQNSGVIYEGSDFYALPRFPMSTAFSDISKFKEKAKMHPLRLKNEEPESFILPDKNSAPELTISFESSNLRLSQLQCFIQGGECIKSINEKDGTATLKVKAKDPLKGRRRTLYTITVPDENGEWHWFSHLWINSDIADR